MRNLKYLLIGCGFGIVLVKSQAVSWWRIQEMFRLQSFHMYGIIGSAIFVGMISVALIRGVQARTIAGDRIIIPKKAWHWGNVYGGLIFGLGWAITGACPGPIYALIEGGYGVVLVTLLSAVAGTWVYGRFRNKLPH